MPSARERLRPVTVTVAGQSLALRTDASPTYLRELAAALDARLATLRASQLAVPATSGRRRPVSTQGLALLCALQLADELHQAQRGHAALRREARQRLQRITDHLALLADGAATAPGPAPRGRRRRRDAPAVR